MTLAEVLIAVVLLVISTSVIASCIGLGTTMFQKQKRISEAQMLLDALSVSIQDELRYATEISGSTAFTYTSRNRAGASGCALSKDTGTGHIVIDAGPGKTYELAAGNLYRKMNTELREASWDAAARLFTIRIEVTDPADPGYIIAEKTFTAEPLNVAYSTASIESGLTDSGAANNTPEAGEDEEEEPETPETPETPEDTLYALLEGRYFRHERIGNDKDGENVLEGTVVKYGGVFYATIQPNQWIAREKDYVTSMISAGTAIALISGTLNIINAKDVYWNAYNDNNPATFSTGDIVKDGNNYYIYRNNANPSPYVQDAWDFDSTNSYWVRFIPSAQAN